MNCHLELLEDQVLRRCDYGDLDGTQNMVLIGDSHADAWLPALEMVAANNGYRLYARTKAACPGVDIAVRDGDLGREYTECETWRRQVMEEIRELEPSIVVMSGSAGIGNQSPADWARATTRTVSSFVEQGIRVVYITDTPRRGDDQTGPDCVAANLEDVSRCITPQDEAVPGARAGAAAASRRPIVESRTWGFYL